MATKTYFGYESQLSSKELTEAVALQHGHGPLFGYGGFLINGNRITIHSTPRDGDTEMTSFKNLFGKLIENRINSRRIQIQSFGTSSPVMGNFGIITTDGYIEVSDSNNIQLDILNNPNLYNEVIVLARHTYSPDINTDIPVVYEAYWNTSSNRFYNLYKKSIDYNYPTLLNKREIEGLDVNISPQEDNTLSYYYLLNTALAATPIRGADYRYYTLVGIYGTGNDLMSDDGSLQKFAIIPYDGEFPMKLNYSWADYNFYKDLLRYLYKIFPDIGNLSFDDYLRKLITEDQSNKQLTSLSVPVGTIVMWYGATSTIPYGWEICDGTASVHNPSIVKPNLMGRFPIGLSSSDTEYSIPQQTGGNNEYTLEIKNIPQHSHVYTADSGSENMFPSVETGFPQAYTNSSPEAVVGTAGTAGNQGVAKAYITSKVGGNKPIDNRPAYTVVAFIIKTLN